MNKKGGSVNDTWGRYESSVPYSAPLEVTLTNGQVCIHGCVCAENMCPMDHEIYIL